MFVGNRKLMAAQGIDIGPIAEKREALASTGRTAVLVAVDRYAAGIIALADAARETDAAAVTAMHDAGIEVVMLTGDNEATASRSASRRGIDTDVAIETADVVLMRSDPLEVPVALRIGKEPCERCGRTSVGPSATT